MAGIVASGTTTATVPVPGTPDRTITIDGKVGHISGTAPGVGISIGRTGLAEDLRPPIRPRNVSADFWGICGCITVCIAGAGVLGLTLGLLQLTGLHDFANGTGDVWGDTGGIPISQLSGLPGFDNVRAEIWADSVRHWIVWFSVSLLLLVGGVLAWRHFEVGANIGRSGAEVKVKNAAREAAFRTVSEWWAASYYCSRDDVVFVPGTSDVTPRAAVQRRMQAIVEGAGAGPSGVPGEREEHQHSAGH